MNVNDLQAITHDLCHGFIRCTRAVSYPAPTYYSHLIAKRAEAYLPYELAFDENTNLQMLNNEYRVSQRFINNTQMFFV
jgi:eukaryotic translation initiation factor 2C